MNRTEFAEALRSAGEVARETDFIVLGSQAIWGLVSRPPKSCQMSMELDIYPRHRSHSVQVLVRQMGRRSPFSRRNGYFIDCVSPEIATIPDGLESRLVPFSSKDTAGVTGWCLDIHDLAVSKLAAGREKDLQYVAALLKGKKLRSAILKRRIKRTPVSATDRAEIFSLLKQVSHPTI